MAGWKPTLKFVDGVRVEMSSRGGVVILGPNHRRLVLDVLPPEILRWLKQLGSRQGALPAGASGRPASRGVGWIIDELFRAGFLTFSAGGSAGFTLFSPRFDPRYLEGAVSRARRPLSRFAYLRPDGKDWVLASGESDVLIRIHSSRLAMSLLGGELARHPGGPLLARMMELAGLLEPASRQAHREVWEFHDLLFHRFSLRPGDPGGRGTYRLAGGRRREPPTPAPRSIGTVGLPAVALASVSRGSAPLVEITRSRRTNRRQGGRPISSKELGEFLFRVAKQPERCSPRPFPAAGALDEIGFYVAIRECRGIEPGFYRYDRIAHAFDRLPATPETVQRMFQQASASWGRENGLSQVLIILSSRFPRLAWKYESIAYRLALLNVGCGLTASDYAATDLRLACTILGDVDPGLFETASKLSPYQETALAQIALGSL